ncbi:MAG: DegV family protein [Candidatus Dormibacteria bacterium]
MPLFHLVADSTAVLDPSYVASHDIRVVPLTVIFGTTEYTDGVDITTSEFYSKFDQSDVPPRTSQPSPGAFAETFSSFDDSLPIMCLTLSSELSGTYNAAVQGAASVPGKTVHVIDTRSVGPPLNRIVMHIQELRDRDVSLDEALSCVQTLIETQIFYFTVPTLEYLRRGGRIGGAQALLGTLLNFRPLLALVNGRVEPIKKIRTFSRVLDQMVELIGEAKDRYGSLEVLVANAHNDEMASVLIKRGTPYSVPKPTAIELGPVIVAHTGPGAVGIGFFPLLPEFTPETATPAKLQGSKTTTSPTE